MATCTSSLVQSDDIYYSGPPLPCIGLENCDTLTTAIEKVEEAICGIFEQLTTTTTTIPI